ncbi:LysR family transcriptional regulator [Pseudomonas sp. F1_0610]|uniref:LysR family transcriptional regulator n=1 Tax=Pseudomonas sp. F1_0610 TaxID=3114284 RepID=UPI0039C49F93
MDRITAAQVFIEVVSQQSQTAAADKLNMSRAMVSRYLQALEAWVGVRLLHRTTRRLSLTETGKDVLMQCQQLVAVTEQMQMLGWQRRTEPAGVLRITSSSSLAQAWLMPYLVRFTQEYPLLKLDFITSSSTLNLVEDRIDLAIRITNQLEPNQVALRLADCTSVLCATPDYLAQHPEITQPEQLSQHNCLTYSYFGQKLWQFQLGNERRSVPVMGNVTANESNLLLEATVQHLGISQQPVYAVVPLIEQGRLVPVLEQWQLPSLGIYAIYTSREHLSPALRALVDFLKQGFSSEQWLHLAVLPKNIMKVD